MRESFYRLAPLTFITHATRDFFFPFVWASNRQRRRGASQNSSLPSPILYPRCFINRNVRRCSPSSRRTESSLELCFDQRLDPSYPRSEFSRLSRTRRTKERNEGDIPRDFETRDSSRDSTCLYLYSRTWRSMAVPFNRESMESSCHVTASHFVISSIVFRRSYYR